MGSRIMAEIYSSDALLPYDWDLYFSCIADRLDVSRVLMFEIILDATCESQVHTGTRDIDMSGGGEVLTMF